MSITVRVLAIITTATLAVGLIVGLVTLRPAEAGWQATATEGVNIRSGPGVSKSIIGGLYRGGTITAVSAANGWTKVRFNGGSGYISSRYLTKDGGPSTPGNVDNGQIKITTTALNVRKGPGLSYDRVSTLPEGTKLTMSGRTSRGFVEIIIGKTKGWVSAQYLASSTGLPKVTGTRTATAELLIRTTSDSDFSVVAEVKKGSKLKITGAHQNGRAQIIYGGAVRWVTAKYLTNSTANGPTAPKLPRVTGTRYATTELMIRSTSADTFKDLGDLARGTKIGITGVEKNGRAQIIFEHAIRWVTAKYLSKRKPSSTGGGGNPDYAIENGLQADTIMIHRMILAKFPQIIHFSGVRHDSWNPEHRDGRAIDLMIPNYGTAEGRAFGDEVAAYLKKNHKKYGINYLIWKQRIWNIERDREGWRWMADRGDDSANHWNHIHVTTYPSGPLATAGSGKVPASAGQR